MFQHSCIYCSGRYWLLDKIILACVLVFSYIMDRVSDHCPEDVGDVGWTTLIILCVVMLNHFFYTVLLARTLTWHNNSTCHLTRTHMKLIFYICLITPTSDLIFYNKFGVILMQIYWVMNETVKGVKHAMFSGICLILFKFLWLHFQIVLVLIWINSFEHLLHCFLLSPWWRWTFLWLTLLNFFL